jgi:hypothetical protein
MPEKVLLSHPNAGNLVVHSKELANGQGISGLAAVVLFLKKKEFYRITEPHFTRNVE